MRGIPRICERLQDQETRQSSAAISRTVSARVIVPVELVIVVKSFAGLFPISSATQAASGDIDKG